MGEAIGGSATIAFETYFSKEDPRADVSAPFGVFNVFDFLAFQALFSEGCA